MVKFCDKCGSMYNHSMDENGQVMYRCLMCGNVDPNVEPCLVINELNHSVFDYPINPHMIHDCTLPRTRKIPCPNCVKDTSKDELYPELIILQYNPSLLNVAYICTVCQHYWKN